MLSQRRGRSWWRWLNFSYRIKCHSSIDYLIWCLKGENFYTIHFILLTAFPTSFPYGKRFLSNWWTNALQHGSTVSSWRFCPQASPLVLFIDGHLFWTNYFCSLSFFWTICIVLDIILDIYLSILHAYSDYFCPLSLYGTKNGRHIVHVDFGYWMLLMIIVILYTCGFWILDVIDGHCHFIYMWILDIGCYWWLFWIWIYIGLFGYTYIVYTHLLYTSTTNCFVCEPLLQVL